VASEDKLTWEVTAQCQDDVDPEISPNSKPRRNSCGRGVSDGSKGSLVRYVPSGGNRVPRIKRKTV